MSAHSKEVIEQFCKLCDWLLQSWQMRKFLFDENPDLKELQSPTHQHFFFRLNIILQEYWLHQLAKLHDPAVQSGQINLSIRYVVDYGCWDEAIKSQLVELESQMAVLAKSIKDARNKILSHNDLAIILESKMLGEFDAGEDQKYFDCLCKFASIVREAVVGDLFLYDNLVKNDVQVFMHTFMGGKT